MFNDNINRLKEKKMFKDIEHSPFLPNGFFILLVFALLWGGSFTLGRYIAAFLLKGMGDETLKLSFRRIITCGFQVFIFFVWVRVIEKRKLSTLGFRGNHKLHKFFIGFLIGIISITIITFLLFLLGAIKIEIRKNINMSISTYFGIALIVIGWVVQSISEEIGIRGWLIPLVGARYNALLSIFLTSITFGVLHLFVPTATVLSFTNLILSGIFFALYAISEDSLWGVWGCHFGWNLALGNIYSFSVSGFSAANAAIFQIEVTGNSILTGGLFGPEGGILATIAVSIGIIILSVRIIKDLGLRRKILKKF